MTTWAIVTENSREVTAFVYVEGLTREQCLGMIEQQFETGDLTREVYHKVSLNNWTFNDYKFIRLLNEKGLKQWTLKHFNAK